MKIVYIMWLIAQLMSTTPAKPLAKNKNLRREYASHLVAAGEKYHKDPDLLTIWYYNESSLNPRAVGSLGEIGLAQIHGRKNRGTCRAAGYDIGTVRGQIYCGALLMDMGERSCGSLRQGLYTYACRACSGCPRGIRAYNYRMAMLRKYRRRYERR